MYLSASSIVNPRYKCSFLILAVFATIGLLGCGEAPLEAKHIDPEITKSFEEFKSRKIYSRLTPEILASIPDALIEQAIIDFVATKLNGKWDCEREVVATFTPGIKALYITWMVDAEVKNRGFNQYYWNHGGQFVDEAPAAFEFFSALQHANLMTEANRIRSNEATAMQKYRNRGTLDAFSESYKESKLAPLDDRFYKIKENLSVLHVSRIRKSPEHLTGE